MELAYTSRKIKDVDYYTMTDYSYRNVKIGQVIEDQDGSVKWKVIGKMNEENGAQGIALAPIDPLRHLKNQGDEEPKAKVDTSQIVIAFRGTEFGKWDGDLTADSLQVVLNSKYVPTTIETAIGDVRTFTAETQFESAIKFADEIFDEYKSAIISYTGHSLGGAMAQYVAAERNSEATTFAAPNIYGLLSDEAKARVDEGKTRNIIKDYVHDNDVVGSFGEDDPLIGKQYVTAVKENSLSWWNPISGHFMSTYTGMFNKGDGSIQFKMEPDEVIKAIQTFRPRLELIRDWRKTIEHYIEDEAHAVRKIYQDMLANVKGSGKYPLLSEHDVTDFFREKAMTVKGSDYYFIDVDMAMDLCQKLKKFEHKMDMFLDDLIKAAETTRNLDKEVSLWFGGRR